MSDRIEKKAAIKRASKAARAQANQLDTDALAHLTRLYANARSQIETDIQAAAQGGHRIKLAQLGLLKQKLTRALDTLATTQQDAIDHYIRTGAIGGAQPFSAFLDTEKINRVIDNSVLTVRTFTHHDGLQLSDRLWRINSGANQAVINQVERAVTLGQSASQAAQQFLQRGQSVPGAINQNMHGANPDTLARKVGKDFMTGDRDNISSYEQAKRVFRTEINRAHGLAYQQSAFEDDDVAGTRFLLSPNHREKDICDMHATVNRYGLGKGVYPQGKSPWPAHPNTLSYEEAVFVDEITAEDKTGKQTRIDWLTAQPESVQYKVLQAKKKVTALQAGILTEQQITTPWRVLKNRYERQGIDVDKLPVKFPPAQLNKPPKKPKPPPAPKREIKQTVASNSPAPEPGTGAPVSNAPVSNALSPKAHKRVTENTLNAIDAVHSDGLLEPIPIVSSSSQRVHGYFQHQAFNEMPLKIAVSSRSDHKDLTLAHEIGHFIDLRGVNKGRGFASENDKRFNAFRLTANDSQAVQNLVDLYYGDYRRAGADGRLYRVDKRYVSYTLRTHEIWARAYSQYIATKSQNPQLMKQLKIMQEKQARSPLPYDIQWKDEDFAPIAKVMDELFRELGWLP